MPTTTFPSRRFLSLFCRTGYIGSTESKNAAARQGEPLLALCSGIARVLDHSHAGPRRSPTHVCANDGMTSVRFPGHVGCQISPTQCRKNEYVTRGQWRIVGSRGPGARNFVGPSAMVIPNVCQLEALEAPRWGPRQSPGGKHILATI